MGDDSGSKPPATANPRSALTAAEVRAFVDRAPRCKVRVAVSWETPAASGDGASLRSGAGTTDAELVDVSSSGMFVATQRGLPIGSRVSFEFKLDDGLVALRGVAEVVRGELRGIGLRFVSLDDDAKEMVARLVAATAPEPPPPAAVEYGHGTIRVRLSAATARFFTYSPLLHVGVGGCFLPADSTVALGTGYELTVVDEADRIVLRCRAKVAATQEGRVGLRFLDVERDALLALRAVVMQLSAARPPTP
jgi:hypothetical protein